MNRVDRLFAILLALQLHGRVTAEALAARFEVSPRTIYRDLAALQQMGVPLVAISGVGYELLDTFRLAPVMLTPAEAAALFLGGRWLMAHAVGDVVRETQTALDKIGAALPPDVRAHVQQLATLIDVFPADHKLDFKAEHLLPLLTAIQQQRVVKIHYQSFMTDAETEREIEPRQITLADGAWYVSAFCRLRGDVRSFRLSRILQLQMQSATFSPRQVYAARQDEIVVRVRFAAVLPHVIERQHYAYRYTDEAGVLVYAVHQLSEISGWLLGFGAQAEVLGPPELREWLLAEAQRLITLLSDGA